MDKFGSLFGSPFSPGDGEMTTGDIKPGVGLGVIDDNDYDPYNDYAKGQMVGGPAGRPIFGVGPGIMPDEIPGVGGPVVPPQNDMPSPAVLPPGFDDIFKNVPVLGDVIKAAPGLGGIFGGMLGGMLGSRPQPQPQPFGQQLPNTRAPGGGGMDYNGNPVGGGMGAQFNFAGPRQVSGPAYGGRPAPGDLYHPQITPRVAPRPMVSPRPAAGPVRPTGSYTRPRRIR